jgi:hypothetical protein
LMGYFHHSAECFRCDPAVDHPFYLQFLPLPPRRADRIWPYLAAAHAGYAILGGSRQADDRRYRQKVLCLGRIHDLAEVSLWTLVRLLGSQSHASSFPLTWASWPGGTER